MYLRPTRRKKRRKMTNLIVWIAIAAAAVVGVFLLLYNFTDLQLFKPLMKETDVPLPQTVQANESGVLFMEENTLYLRDQKGGAVWDLKLDTPDAKFSASPSLICTYAQANLQALSYTKEQLFSASAAANIIDARCGKSTIAVLTSATDEATQKTFYYLTLFNSKGQAGQVEYKARQVIDFGFTGDSDTLWSLSLDSSNVTPVSYITTYKSDGSPVGSIENNTQIIERVKLTGDTIYASGTNNIFSYNFFGEKQNEALIYGWEPASASVTQTGFEAAYVPRRAGASFESAKLFSTDLSETVMYLPQKTFGVAVTQNRFYAYTPNAVMTYQLSGSLEKTTKLEYTLTSAKQLSDTLVVAWDREGKSYLMQLG